ncbi:MAG: prepilin peptidase [Desulfonauticus sp.]|nr:prepilin peptidase [Desulfonauticus sp.]
MDNCLAMFVFILGTCLGSFYNVCIVRYLKGESVFWPGSHCPVCKHRLSWWENIPLLSFLLLRGKCSRCKAKISWLYPCVELIAGILTLALYWKFGMGLEFFLYTILFGILIVASFIDLQSFILPDRLTLSGGILALGFSFWLPVGPKMGFLGAGSGFLVFWSIQKGYKWLKGQEGLGGGDVKLMIMLGAMVGLSGLPVLIFASAVFALLGSVFFWLQGKTIQAKTPIPYGPFLSLAAILYVLAGDVALDLFHKIL